MICKYFYTIEKRESQFLRSCPYLTVLDLLGGLKASWSSYYFVKLAKHCQGFGECNEITSVKCSTNRKVKDQHMWNTFSFLMSSWTHLVGNAKTSNFQEPLHFGAALRISIIYWLKLSHHYLKYQYLFACFSKNGIHVNIKANS